ncbi:hypothetical protein B4Q04_22385 [Zobellia sp. OII3]|uniref:hypothetical protein n=1 Tax=Zobellia sp. OII3 TaxID=2034520 RepID=UPI000B52C92E|nr:hypothetical protein [Zobellia sp. OII3]OWW23105.1 hypothetical protein B4Q04_22385 [Zobellia sp. OII3]
MRITLKLFLILILAIQCKNIEEIDSQKIDWQETKNSRNYVDYATYIQKHPNTENFSKALSEYFFLRDSIADFGGCYRFNASISVTDSAKVLFDDELKSLDSLRFYTFQYLKNGKPNISSSLKTDIQIPESKLRDSISTGRFDIVIYDKPYPIENLKKAIIEISKGIKDYKKYLSEEWFQKPYSELSKDKRAGIDKLNDQRLVFFDFTNMDGKRFNPPLPISD